VVTPKCQQKRLGSQANLQKAMGFFAYNSSQEAQNNLSTPVLPCLQIAFTEY